MAGRYLVSHNHFHLSLADLNDERRRFLTLYSAQGDVILKDAPFHAFDVLVADRQTLLFDFGPYGGQGGMTIAELDNPAGEGSSGGAIFYQGYHLGNNWFRAADRQAETGELLRAYSAAALNTGAGLAGLAGAIAQVRSGDSRPPTTHEEEAPAPPAGRQHTTTSQRIFR